jgi:CheY-like chemotaxis protein
MSIQNPKIMVIEDEGLLLQAITKKLKLNNIETVSCVNGEQALDYLKDMPELPDAIWLDYHLSGMDGLTLMRLLKENTLWQNIPVFVVSNSASPEKVTNMLALGAKQYLIKAEHRLDEIIKTIRDFIVKNKQI